MSTLLRFVPGYGLAVLRPVELDGQAYYSWQQEVSAACGARCMRPAAECGAFLGLAEIDWEDLLRAMDQPRPGLVQGGMFHRIAKMGHSGYPDEVAQAWARCTDTALRFKITGILRRTWEHCPDAALREQALRLLDAPRKQRQAAA